MYMPQEVNKRTHSHSHIQLNMSTVMFSLCYNNFLGGGGEGGGGGGVAGSSSREIAMIYNKSCVL